MRVCGWGAPTQSQTNSTYIGAAYNLANVVPLLYIYLNHRRPISDKSVVVLSAICAMASAVALALAWRVTAVLGGSSVSIVIIGMSFAAGACGCLLGVVLFAYASGFRPLATTALSLGMGLNGILVTACGVLQKANGNKYSELVILFVFLIITRSSVWLFENYIK